MLIFQSKGNIELLSQRKLAVFASQHAPQEIASSAAVVFEALQKLPLSLAGGWQAPLERRLLEQADAGLAANYILYLAKDINAFRPTPRQQRLLDENKLLVLSPEIKAKRASQSLVKQRDALLFSQIDSVLFLYIHPGGRLEGYLRELSARKSKLYILNHPLNRPCFGEDILPLDGDTAEEVLGVGY